MSDDAKRVWKHYCEEVDWYIWEEDDDGTHAILPWSDYERLRAEVARLRCAIEEHRLYSQGWRDASETDKTLWASKYEDANDA